MSTGFSVLFVIAAILRSATSQVDLHAPSQASLDSPATGSMPGTWGDVPGGVTGRPYVRSLRIWASGYPESTPTTVMTGTSPTNSSPSEPTEGGLTAVISPTNACRTGQTEGCYETPNRFGVLLGLYESGLINMDLSTDAGITPSSVIELEIALNTIGATARWTWFNGNMNNVGTDVGISGGILTLRFRPVSTAAINWAEHPEASGCSATPIRSCNLQRPDARYLGANGVVSIDESLSGYLRGAVFSTVGALFGYLDLLSEEASGARIVYQLAGPHYRNPTVTDGIEDVASVGSLRAFIPSNAFSGFFGIGDDASEADVRLLLSVQRVEGGTSDAGFTLNPYDYGRVVGVNLIGFSAPKYRVRNQKAAFVPFCAKTVRQTTTVAIGDSFADARCKASRCRFSVARVLPSGKQVFLKMSGKSNKNGTFKKVSVSVPASKLKKGQTVAVQVIAGKKLIRASVHEFSYCPS